MKPDIIYRFSCKDHNCNYFSADEFEKFKCDDCHKILSLSGKSKVIRKTNKQIIEMHRKNASQRMRA